MAQQGTDWGLVLGIAGFAFMILGYVGTAAWFISRMSTIVGTLKEAWERESKAVRDEMRALFGAVSSELQKAEEKLDQLGRRTQELGERTAELAAKETQIAEIRDRLNRLESARRK